MPSHLLKSYLVEKAHSYDDFIAFRKLFAYQYGTLLCYNYIFSIETKLSDFLINLQTGYINTYDNKFNYKPSQANPLSIRLSNNIYHLFGDTFVNAGVIPAFVATIDALKN